MADFDFKKSLLRHRLKKTKGSIVRLTILIYEDLLRKGHSVQIVPGFACWGTHGCWHLWIESDGTVLDVGQEMFKIPVLHLKELPNGTERVDKTPSDFEEEFKLWVEDPKKYFSSSQGTTTSKKA